MSNVKPGDTAQIIRATGGFEWTLMRVVRIGERCGCAEKMDMPLAWRFEQPLMEHDTGCTAKCAFDRCLKRLPPVEDGHGQDEEAGTPVTTEKETVHEFASHP